MKWLFFILLLAFPPKEKEVIWRTGKTYDEGFCGDQIIFYKNHFLVYHMGCEANNSLRFGIWKQQKDSVEITYSDTLNFELIKSVDIQNGSKSDSVLVKVMDCYDRPIEDALFYGFPKGMNLQSQNRMNEVLKISKRLPMLYIESFYQEDSLIGLKLYETDSKGLFFVKRSEIDSIQLVLSNQLSVKPVRYNLFGSQSAISIQTTIPAEAFEYEKNTWIYFPLQSKFHINNLKKP